MIYKYNEISVYYKVFGKQNLDKNIPILFLHGWGGSCKSFEIFAKKLKENFTCILLDFPPFGNSSEPLKPIFVKDYSNLVLEVLKKLKIDEINIVAHSFGGRVALELNSLNSSLTISKIILTGSAGIKKRSIKKDLKVLKFKILKFFSKMGLYKKENLNKFGSEDYRSLSNIMKQTFKNIVNYNQIDKVKLIKCPTLLIWGKNDKETPFYFTKTFKKHIKDCEVIAFEGCSHFAYLEKPNEFLAVIQSFFKK